MNRDFIEGRLTEPWAEPELPPNNYVLIAEFTQLQAGTIIRLNRNLNHETREREKAHQQLNEANRLHDHCMTLAKGEKPQKDGCQYSRWDNAIPIDQYHPDMTAIASLYAAWQEEKHKRELSDEAAIQIAELLKARDVELAKLQKPKKKSRRR